MRLTKRLALLMFFGIVPLLFSGMVPRLLIACLVYDGVLLALAFADYLITPRPLAAWDVTREVGDRLSLGVENPVAITARPIAPTVFSFGSARLVQSLVIRDEPPKEFEILGQTTQIARVPPDQEQTTIKYAVMPSRQGDFRFGDLFLRSDSPLGLIQRIEKLSCAISVKVYPNLQETEKYDLLARKGRLMQVGIRTVRIRGGGSEFESLRDYVPGDEYRRIDWSATARRGKLITRQYNVERAQNILLVIDTGRTMLQPVQKMTKLDYVINTALMLGYVAASQDDKVGLMVFDAEVRTFLPPAKGKSQVYRLLNSLYNVSAQMVESDYRTAFKELATRWRRRSLVVVFTDLVDPESSAEILNTISLVEDLHRTVCVTVADPNILAAAQSDPQTEAEVYRKSVALQVLQERRQAISQLKRRGVWTIDSPPEALSADLINHYMDLKARSAI